MFSRYTRVGIILASFIYGRWASAPVAALKSQDHPRPVSYAEGEAIAQAALLHRALFRDKPDCSHFVHDVYAEAGLDYDYATTWNIFEGIPTFDRVQKAQPGDIIVWRGHAGIVIDPEDRSFYSSVISGYSIHSYASGYWTTRGAHRFYRYKVNNVQSERLFAGVPYHPPVPATAKPPGHQRLLVASSEASSNSLKNGKTLVPQRKPSARVSKIAASTDSVPGENGEAVQAATPSGSNPAHEEVRLAVAAFTESNAQGLAQAAALNGPIEIIDGFEVASTEMHDDSGWADVKVKKIAFIADGKIKSAHAVETIRLNLRLQASGWVVSDTANRTYVLRQAAVRIVSGRLAALSHDSSSAQQRKALTQALGMLLANDRS